MADESRRSFFKNFFVKKPFQIFNEAYDSYQESMSDLDYFESFESAYTFISENMPFIEDEVQRLNIATEGKSNLDIVREIYEKNKEKL